MFLLQVMKMVRASQVAQWLKSTCQCRRRRIDPSVGKILWRRKWQHTLVVLPEKSHKQRSLVVYSPRGHKELDRTEHV